jgi:hypothetical protein
VTHVAEPETVQAPSAERVECPVCDKVFAGGAIVTSEPEYVPALGQYRAVRRVYCDHCDHLVIWEQTSNSNGSRLGIVLNNSMSIARGKHVVEKFLAAHPEAAGIVAV